jgi:hypothetical protein
MHDSFSLLQSEEDADVTLYIQLLDFDDDEEDTMGTSSLAGNSNGNEMNDMFSLGGSGGSNSASIASKSNPLDGTPHSPIHRCVESMN